MLESVVVALVAVLVLVSGCGLTIDLDPPQQDGTMDAAVPTYPDGATTDRHARPRDALVVTDGPSIDGRTPRDAASPRDATTVGDARVPIDAPYPDAEICVGYPCGTDCCDPRDFEVCCEAAGFEPYCAGMCL